MKNDQSFQPFMVGI